MPRRGFFSARVRGGQGSRSACVPAVFRKEATELIRDRRTVIVSLAVPLVLFPLLVVLGLAGTAEQAREGAYRVLVSGSPSQELRLLLEEPAHGFTIVGALPAQGAADEAITDEVTARDVTVALEAGRADAGLLIEAAHHELGDEPTLVVRYDNSSPRSTAAAGVLHGLLAGYARARSDATLRAMGIDPDRVSPVDVEMRSLYVDEVASGYLALGLLLPVLALVAGALSPLASAVDLGAGEKERGTLETLLGTRAARADLIIGKYLAVLLMGLVGTAAFFAGAAAAIAASSLVVETPLVLPAPAPSGLVVVILLVASATAVCAALELCISLWAPSAKAAQAYTLPLLILSSAAGYGASAVGSVPHAWWTAAVPLLNLAVGLRSVVAGGGAVPGHGWFLITAATVPAMVVGALGVATWLCGRESVLRRR